MSKLGKNISKIRKVKKLTQKMLAEDADINYRHFQDIEGDKADIRLSTATEIAKILQVPVSTLFHEHVNVNLIKNGIASFYTLLDIVPAGICITDTQGKIMYVNKYFVDHITNKTEEELLNDCYAWSLMPENMRPQSQEILQRLTLDQSIEPKPVYRVYVGPEQKNVHVYVSWQYLRDQDNNFSGFISVAVPHGEPEIPNRNF